MANKDVNRFSKDVQYWRQFYEPLQRQAPDVLLLELKVVAAKYQALCSLADVDPCKAVRR